MSRIAIALLMLVLPLSASSQVPVRIEAVSPLQQTLVVNASASEPFSARA